MRILKNLLKGIVILCVVAGILFLLHYLTISLALLVSEPKVTITKAGPQTTVEKKAKYTKKDVKRMLHAAVSSKSHTVRAQWESFSMNNISEIIYSFGYEYLNLSPVTALAIISHESGFNNHARHFNKECDDDGDCVVVSVDYFMTQQNSVHAKSRYYNLRHQVQQGNLNPEVTKILKRKLTGQFSIEKLRDPEINIALMFQTILECRELLKRRAAVENRVILCYNSPTYSKRVRGDRLPKVKYVKEVLRHRDELVNLI